MCCVAFMNNIVSLVWACNFRESWRRCQVTNSLTWRKGIHPLAIGYIYIRVTSIKVVSLHCSSMLICYLHVRTPPCFDPRTEVLKSHREQERKTVHRTCQLFSRVTCLSLYVITVVAKSTRMCMSHKLCFTLNQTSSVFYTDCMHDLYALAACMISGGIYRRVDVLL